MGEMASRRRWDGGDDIFSSLKIDRLKTVGQIWSGFCDILIINSVVSHCISSTVMVFMTWDKPSTLPNL